MSSLLPNPYNLFMNLNLFILMFKTLCMYLGYAKVRIRRHLQGSQD